MRCEKPIWSPGKLIAGVVENIDVDANGQVIKDDGDPKMRGKPLVTTQTRTGPISILVWEKCLYAHVPQQECTCDPFLLGLGRLGDPLDSPRSTPGAHTGSRYSETRVLDEGTR